MACAESRLLTNAAQPELAQRNAANLHKIMEDANAEKSLVRALPTLAKVETWVTEAKGMERAIFY